MGKLNNILMLVNKYTVLEFTTAGTHTASIPGGVTTIYVTAVGGGGSGAYPITNITSFSSNNNSTVYGNPIYVYATNGGNGGQVVYQQKVTLAAHSAAINLTVTVGAGGKFTRTAANTTSTSTMQGAAGETTTVKNGSTTLVTASGGAGGKISTSYKSANSTSVTTLSGATQTSAASGSGKGGLGYLYLVPSATRIDAITATDLVIPSNNAGAASNWVTSAATKYVGNSYNNTGGFILIGGCGGASWGRGGVAGYPTGNNISTSPMNLQVPEFGGGGAGVGAIYQFTMGSTTTYNLTSNSNGASGYVKIEWGY